MSVKTEQATVFRISNGKRYFTERAAFRREAIIRLSKKHEKAGCNDYLRGGDHYQETHFTDDQCAYFLRVANRYYRLCKHLRRKP